jgi:branched-chain amino acid transport system ATP-binding protein
LGLAFEGRAMKAVLDVRDVSKRFGGLQALHRVSFELREGEILGLIGPNGAGKTTLFNVLVGLSRPGEGSIRLNGCPIAGLAPHRIAALGLTKTFQNVALFSESTVLDNVLIGGLLRHSVSDARDVAHECLSRVGLLSVAQKSAGALSFPEKARVEVARALATAPKVILFDEVMAALNAIEMAGVMDLIRELAASGLSIVVVEHHMKAIMGLSHRIIALNFGRVIAEGPPVEIARHPDVVTAYLGKAYVH